MTRVHAPASVGFVVALAALTAACSSSATSSTSPAPTAPTPTTSTSVLVPKSTTTTRTGAAPAPRLAPGRQIVTFVVGGVKRTAVVVVPAAGSEPSPLVFVFHGHGGTGANIERKFRIEALWPQAVVVYPYGLVGHAGRTDPTGVKPGWQTSVGESGDRDLKFYDVMLASIRSQLAVDAERVYAMGHSNGSAFVSLLLNQRGAGLAATANLSAQPPARMLVTDPVRSMFLAMGMTDPIVPYANQKRAIPVAEAKLGVDPSTARTDGDLVTQRGRGKLELDTFVYPGGHEPPAIVPGLVVAFFRRHTRSGG